MHFSESNLKIIRIFIISFVFLCMAYVVGMKGRIAHQIFFMMGAMVLLSLLLKNIWITLFFWWTVFLYTFFKFKLGNIYLNNVFYGCVLYYLTKISFKKEHITFFINAVLWLLVVNLLYMFVQMGGYDFLYRNINNQVNYKPIGFLGNPGVTGAFLAMCIPLLATRRRWYLSLLLFLPLYLTGSNFNYIAGGVALLFILFFKIPRKIWIALLVSCLLVGGFYLKDKIHDERLVTWHLALQDYTRHPVTGWGLDSYRHLTKEKRHIYIINFEQHADHTAYSYWDNPHNLIVSLLYEWGLPGLIIFLGLLRHYGVLFKNSIKEPNTLALSGFLLVFLVVSMFHFPMFLARMCVIIIPIAALFEIQTA